MLRNIGGSTDIYFGCGLRVGCRKNYSNGNEAECRTKNCRLVRSLAKKQ